MYNLNPQEIPYDSPESCNMFVPNPKPFVVTPGVMEEHGETAIDTCLAKLQALAVIHHGLDYLQSFTCPGKEPLWFIEDGDGGAITALLPSEY